MIKKSLIGLSRKFAVAICVSAMCIFGGVITSQAAESVEVEDGGAELASTSREALIYGTTKKHTFEESYDSVIYDFSLDKAGCVTFDVRTYSSGIAWLMYDENGKEVFTGRSKYYFSYSDVLGYGKNSINADLLPGSYYLKIWSDYTQNDQTYELKATYIQAKVTEKELNDNCAMANSLSRGKMAYGQLAMNDEYDYYKIYVPQTTEIRINIASKKIEGLYLYLYDADGNKSESSYLCKDGSSANTLNRTKAYKVKKGTYYICVKGDYNIVNGSIVTSRSYTGTYTLKYDYGITMTSKNVRLSTDKCEYNGKVRNPSVIVKDNNGKKLVKGRDYLVNIPGGRKNIGSYTYKIVFTGNYKGTVKKTFTISPARTKITTIANKKAGIRIKWKASSSANATGYIVYRSINGGAYKAIKVISNNRTATYGDTSAYYWGSKYSYKVIVYKKVAGKTYKSVASSARSVYR